MPVITEKPIFSARARTRLRVWRGQIGDGVWSGLTNSPRKNGTWSSHGTVRWVDEVEPRERVGESVLPAGERGVVVGLVGDVPAEDDVAEAEAARRRRLGGAEELVDVQVLAAQDAVDVADRDLDLVAAALADGGERRMLWGGCRHVIIIAGAGGLRLWREARRRWLESSQPLARGRSRPSTSECLHAQIRLACPPCSPDACSRRGPAWSQAARFVGAGRLDAGVPTRQRTVLIRRRTATRCGPASARPSPNRELGPAEATLAAVTERSRSRAPLETLVKFSTASPRRQHVDGSMRPGHRP